MSSEGERVSTAARLHVQVCCDPRTLCLVKIVTMFRRESPSLKGIVRCLQAVGELVAFGDSRQ
jgi:hypothetical protein